MAISPWLSLGLGVLIAVLPVDVSGQTELPWRLPPEKKAELRALLAQIPRGNNSRNWTPIRDDDPQLVQRFRQRLGDVNRAMRSLAADTYALPPADVAIWTHAAAIPLVNGEWKYPGRVEFMNVCLDWCEQLVEEHRRNSEFSSTLRGRFTVGYRSAIDRSVQPYIVSLPGDYQPHHGKPYRLNIFLHGLTRWKGEPLWMVDGNLSASVAPGNRESLDERDSASRTIRVHPFGRLDTFYRGPGEIDVFEVIEDVRRRYPIDPNGISITGFSMGGGGTMRVVLLNPTSFACMAPMGMAVFGGAAQQAADYAARFAPLA